MRRRRALELTDYGAALDAVGDRRVGAYARRQRRRQVLIGIGGVALIVGAALLYGVLRPRMGGPPGERYPVQVRCVDEACGYEGQVTVGESDEFPLVCPSCGRRSCRVLWRCLSCGATFLPARPEGAERCPRCNSAAVGSAAVLPAKGSGLQADDGNGR